MTYTVSADKARVMMSLALTDRICAFAVAKLINTVSATIRFFIALV
jgi:hypothetical protein